MDPVSLSAFEDEMSKIAGFKDLLQKVLDLFRKPEDRASRKADYFFSPKAGDDRWTKLPNQARSQSFVDAIAAHPSADEKLKAHVQGLHDLGHGKPVAKIKSTKSMGKTYEIRRLPGGGLGCQCGDWKFRGTVIPGYECKHIKEYRSSRGGAA